MSEESHLVTDLTFDTTVVENNARRLSEGGYGYPSTHGITAIGMD